MKDKESARKNLELRKLRSEEVAVGIEVEKEKVSLLEAKFQAIFETSLAAIFIADIKTGKLIECNRQAERLLGKKREEIIGQSQASLHPPEEEKNYKALFRKHIKSENAYEFNAEVIHKDGRRIPVLIAAQPIDLDGKKIIIGSFIDLTERIKMQEELAKMQRLESIGLLVGGLVHDFNNYLNSILMCLSYGRSLLKPQDELLEIFANMQAACDSARDLAQQLLSFTTRGQPIKRLVSLDQFLAKVVSLPFSVPNLTSSKVKRELFIAQDLSCVEIDETQLTQVLTNLLINAEQSMPKGGVITVLAENVSQGKNPSLPGKGQFIQISIKDQGCGIPKEDMPKIFDPFFTTKPQGRGLGLATAFSIVKKHGGILTCESMVGMGTTFYLYLPACPKRLGEGAAASKFR